MRKKYFLISSILILATFAAYFPLWSNGFIGYDDWQFVTANPYVQRGLSWEGIRWALQTNETANWYPLTWISHMLDCQFFGLNAQGHHFVSLFLHTLNALLLFLFLQSVTHALWPSALVAALFSLHPLHVESVAWVAERKDVLSTFFWFLAMFAYSRYIKTKSRKIYFITGLFFLLGLMSKPMLVSLPCVFLLLDYWPFRRFQSEKWTALLGEKIPFFMLSIIFSIITIQTQIATHSAISLEGMTLDVRLKNAVTAYAGYIQKMFWPKGLSVFYPHPGVTISSLEVITSACILILITIFVLRTTSRRPYLGMGWFWYLGTLVPVIGLVQVGAQAMADRYTYIPLTGLFIMAAWLGRDVDNVILRPKAEPWFRRNQDLIGFDLPSLGKKPRGEESRSFATLRMTAIFFIVSVLSVLGFLTSNQVRYWKNDVTVFEHALRVTKRNYIAYNGLGLIYAQQGRIEEAIDHFSKAVEIYPNFPEGQNNLGLALKHAGNLAASRIHLFRAAAVKPNFYQAYNNLGNVFFAEGNFSEALRYFSKAIEVKPDYARGYYNRGVVLTAIGNYEGAIVQFEQALRLDPSQSDARHNIDLVREKLAALSAKPN